MNFCAKTYQVCTAFSTSSTSFSDDLYTSFFKELQKNGRFFFVEKCHFVTVQFTSSTKSELEIFGQRFCVLNTQWTINSEFYLLLWSIGITKGEKKRKSLCKWGDICQVFNMGLKVKTWLLRAQLRFSNVRKPFCLKAKLNSLRWKFLTPWKTWPFWDEKVRVALKM